MYLRNVKQILRQAEGGFDERRYGFGGLMDLLKALQRDSVVRIERDRRGGLRVFQGAALQKYAHSVPLDGLPQVDESYEAIEALVESEPGEPIEAIESQGAATAESNESDPVEIEPMPIDTTAELLGRAAPRPKRARTARTAAAPAAKRTAAKKPAARKSTRTRKTAASEANDDSKD
jgi:hypothetical protein